MVYCYGPKQSIIKGLHCIKTSMFVSVKIVLRDGSTLLFGSKPVIPQSI